MNRFIDALKTLPEALIFQVGAWALALVLCAQLVGAVRDLTRAETLKAELVVPAIDVRTTALKKDDYLAVRERLAGTLKSGGVVITAQDNGLSIKAEKVQDYLAWRVALADAMLAMPGAVWSVQSLCAGQACPDQPFQVTLSAVVRSLAVASPGPGAAPGNPAARPG